MAASESHNGELVINPFRSFEPMKEWSDVV